MKTLKFSWAGFEALVTSSIIGGKQLFHGEGQRSNDITWFVTLNGVNLSTDIAQRAVIIKLKRAVYSGDWWEDVDQFIKQHQREIIGDIIAALRVNPSRLRGTRGGRHGRRAFFAG